MQSALIHYAILKTPVILLFLAALLLFGGGAGIGHFIDTGGNVNTFICAPAVLLISCFGAYTCLAVYVREFKKHMDFLKEAKNKWKQ